MRVLGLAIAAGALLAATQANAGSFPVNSGLNGAGSDLVDQIAVRVYVHEGQRYCFYFNGWHGPGWYRCGFAFRRGLGWGGVYGWNDWNYGPYERRHHTERMGVESGSRRTTTGVETRTKSTTGTGIESGTRVRGGTTGSGPNADVKSGGGAKNQGGPTGEGAGMRGGASGKGTPAGEGAPKQ